MPHEKNINDNKKEVRKKIENKQKPYRIWPKFTVKNLQKKRVIKIGQES